MTSRQAGKRTVASQRRKRTAKRGGQHTMQNSSAALSCKERRQLLQLVICGSIFVVLVAVKLLMPTKMAQLHGTLSSAMERNMDVQEVFSAVGRAFSGEENVRDSAQEVYQAVFRPETDSSEKIIAQYFPDEATGWKTLQAYRQAGEEEIIHQKPESVQEQIATLAYVLYSEENLPESVSMEQEILGFEYCTPVNGTISSSFGYREHPTEGDERFHYGIDLAAEKGTEIRCFAEGTVTAVGESSSYGKYCIVAHDGGFSTLYAHCDRIKVASGSNVQVGDTIAEVGETGMVTGPHLHFELQKNNMYLNPIYYLTGL